MDTAVEALQFLTQSENRIVALSALSADAPLDRDELEARLDSSHRTVVRIVNTLIERGYLTETPDGLVLTPFGTHVADRIDDFVTDAETVLEYRPLLRHAPSEFEDLPLDALDGAEQVVASESDPFAVLDRLLAVRADATRIREIAPAVEQKSLDQLARRVECGEELDVEIVVPESASDAAASRPEYREQHRTALTADGVDIYVHPGPIRFAAGVVGDTAAVAVGRNGRPHALALSDAPEMQAWVTTLFKEYRAAATLKPSI